MGKYSSESDSSDSGRGRKTSKYSSRSKGRSRSSSSESSHRRHRRRCKGRRSRSKDRYKSRRYGGSKSSSTRGRSSSSESSSDDSSRRKTKSKRSPPIIPSIVSAIVQPPSTAVESNQSSAEQLKAKVQKAIQAARSADNLLRQRRGEIADDPILIPQGSLLDEINSNYFVQKAFTSRGPLPDIPLPVVVDIKDESKHQAADLGVMSPVLLEDLEEKQKRWVKKLYAIRQKALLGEAMVVS